jgi:hypothetical protein
VAIVLLGWSSSWLSLDTFKIKELYRIGGKPNPNIEKLEELTLVIKHYLLLQCKGKNNN